MKSKQQGMTLISLVIGGGLLVFVSIIVMKMVPSYIEYFDVKKVLQAMRQDPAVSSMPPAEIRAAFDKRADIDNIKSVSGRDLTLNNDSISADWEAKSYLMGNVSVVMEFHASTKISSGQ